MTSRDPQDLIGGTLLIGVGIGFTAYSVATLDLGRMSKMGPGLFPAALGVILALIGLAILIPALFRAGRYPVRPEFGPTAAVAGAIFVFALCAKPFGLVPAVMLMTLVASIADGRTKIWMALLLGIFLAALCSLIFVAGLNLQFPLVTWPF